MRRPNHGFAGYVVPAVFAVLILGLGFSLAPSNGHAQSESVAISSGATSVTSSMHDATPIATASLYAATIQNGATPASATPSQAKQVELPEGEGKAIATEYCKDCHALTNVTKAQKSLDEWRKYVQSLMDRGGRLPQDKVETLVQYLAKNFGPQGATPSSMTSPAGAPSAARSQANKVELPERGGKAIGTEYCQDCHALTNVTRAQKSLDEWRDTVQMMLDRGARLPQDQVETLVQYLAKNFGPQGEAPPTGITSTAPAQPK